MESSETLVCTICDNEWSRGKTSGPKPTVCPPCKPEQKRRKERRVYWNSHEKTLERKRNQYWRTKDKENARAKDYYYRNRERLVAKSRQWNVDNRERYNQTQLTCQLRRRKNLVGEHTTEEWLEIKRLVGDRCVKCGVHESYAGTLHRDHIVPISWGGMNTIENIQPLCSTCNLRKSNTEDVNYLP